MFRGGAAAGTPTSMTRAERELQDDEDEGGRPDAERERDEVDEAVDDSFPASDPPSYGSAEPG
jgi:hypothetical protein